MDSVADQLIELIASYAGYSSAHGYFVLED